MITLEIEPSGMGGEDDSVVTINNDSTINLGRGTFELLILPSPFLQHVSWHRSLTQVSWYHCCLYYSSNGCFAAAVCYCWQFVYCSTLWNINFFCFHYSFLSTSLTWILYFFRLRSISNSTPPQSKTHQLQHQHPSHLPSSFHQCSSPNQPTTPLTTNHYRLFFFFFFLPTTA